MQAKPLRILQLCKKFPFPLVDGESIAVHYLSRGLTEHNCEMDLLSMNTTKQYVEVDVHHEQLAHYERIAFVNVDNRVTITGALKNLFTGDSYHLSRFIVESFRLKLAEFLSTYDYDVILLETVYLAPYIETIRKSSSAKVVLRSHNVEYRIWERIAEETDNPIKRSYLNYLSQKLKRAEISYLDDVDLIASVSQKDIDQFRVDGFKGASFHSFIGLDMEKYRTDASPKDSKSMKIGFIGSLDWRPNLNGIQWFIQHVWPLVMAQKGNMQLTVAGRNPSAEFLLLKGPGLDIIGEVESAIDFMQGQDVMIVPLFSGSGIKVKILEAMALGKIVITTEIGLEGIHATDAEHLYIANTAEEFLEKLNFIHKNPDVLPKVRANARTFVITHFGYSSIGRALAEKLKAISV